MTAQKDLLKILREQTERMRIDVENLFADIDKLHEFVSIQYDLFLKRETEYEIRRKKETSGAFYSPKLDGVRHRQKLSYRREKE
jgi:hypothetical protein